MESFQETSSIYLIETEGSVFYPQEREEIMITNVTQKTVSA